MTNPDDVLFLSKWAQEIIFGLVSILLIILRFIGARMGGEKVKYATKEELTACSSNVADKIDKLGDKLDDYMTKVHERIDRHIESE